LFDERPPVDINKSSGYFTKGIEAEKKGAFPEALFNYFNAEYYAGGGGHGLSRIAEITDKRIELSRKITSGDPWQIEGNNAKRAIELERKWGELWEEIKTVLDNAPFELTAAELEFNCEPGSVRINYADETVTYNYNLILDFENYFITVWNASFIKNQSAHLTDAVFRAGSDKEAEITALTRRGKTLSAIAADALFEADDAEYLKYQRIYTLRVELLNGRGETLDVTPEPPRTIPVYYRDPARQGLSAIAPFFTLANDGGLSHPATGAVYDTGFEGLARLGFAKTAVTEEGLKLTAFFNEGRGFEFSVDVDGVTDTGMGAKITAVYEYGVTKDLSHASGALVDGALYDTAVLLNQYDKH
jgi:hypothetical protein